MTPTFHARLVGNSFRPAEAQVRMDELVQGEHLLLEREPSNKYDSNAIQVLDEDGLHLGYIAGSAKTARGTSLSVEIAPWIDNGHDFTCTVLETGAAPLLELTPNA